MLQKDEKTGTNTSTNTGNQLTLRFGLVVIAIAVLLYFILKGVFNLLFSGSIVSAIFLVVLIFAMFLVVFKFISKFIITEEITKMAQWYSGRYNGIWIFTAVKLKSNNDFFREVRLLQCYEHLVDIRLIRSYEALRNAVRNGSAAEIDLAYKTYQRNMANGIIKNATTIEDEFNSLIGDVDGYVELYPVHNGHMQTTSKK